MLFFGFISSHTHTQGTSSPTGSSSSGRAIILLRIIFVKKSTKKLQKPHHNHLILFYHPCFSYHKHHNLIPSNASSTAANPIKNSTKTKMNRFSSSNSITHSKLSTNFRSIACPVFFIIIDIISSIANSMMMPINIFSLLRLFAIVSSIRFTLLNKPGIIILPLVQIGSSCHSKYLHLSGLYKCNPIYKHQQSTVTIQFELK